MPSKLVQRCYEILMKYRESNLSQQGTLRRKARMLLDCAETYPNTIIRYKSSDMVLHVDSDAAYITMLEAISFYAGHFYLRYFPSPKPIKPNPNRNGPIHTECKTIRNTLSSAPEAETSGTFNNGKTAIGM